MKALDAIKELKSYAEHSWGGLNEAFETAISALEKQIPKKPNLKNATDYEGNIIDGVFICSECGRTICYEIEGNFKENYPCCNCGQVLDWNIK